MAALDWKDAQASLKLTLTAAARSSAVAALSAAWAAKPTQEAVSANPDLHCCTYSSNRSSHRRQRGYTLIFPVLPPAAHWSPNSEPVC